MLNLLDKPSMLHAAAVHMPIALSMLGVPLVFIAVVLSADRVVFRRMAFVCYLLLIGSAVAATWTGEMARELVPPTIDTTASNLIDTHEQMANAVWIFGAVTAALLGLSLIKLGFLRVPWVYRSIMGLSMVASLSTAGWVAFTGHYGGELVYEHGIGTPAAHREYTPPATRPGLPDTPTDAAPVPSDDEPWPGDEEAEAELVPIRPIDMEAAQAVSFVQDIWPIVQAKCLECHEGFSAKGDYSMESIADMMLEGKKAGPGIVPGDPDASSVVKYIRGEFKPQMPHKEPPLSEDELHLFRLWIAAGARDDSSDQPLDAATPEPAAPAHVETPDAETPAPPAPQSPDPAEPADDSTDEDVQSPSEILSPEPDPPPDGPPSHDDVDETEPSGGPEADASSPLSISIDEVPTSESPNGSNAGSERSLDDDGSVLAPEPPTGKESDLEKAPVKDEVIETQPGGSSAPKKVRPRPHILRSGQPVA